MRNFFIVLFFLFVTACSNNKNVYWCGDHPCIDDKERENYFKKTMIVEVRELSKEKKKSSEIQKIIQQASLEEKKRIKNEKNLAKITRLEEKRRIKEEKELAKQIRLEEKMRIKQEKELAKKIRLEKKRRIKEEKKISKIIEKKEISKNSNKINKVEIKTFSTSSEIGPTIFDKMVEKIIKRNMLKPYPSINDIPN